MDKRKVILQLVLIHLNAFIGKSDDIEALINVQDLPGNNYKFETIIYASNYQLFHDAFFSPQSDSIFLKYERDSSGSIYISKIQWTSASQANNTYFRCSNNKASKQIDCNRDIYCATNSQMCVNGFGVYWAQEGEYILSRHLETTKVYCLDGYNATCYTLMCQEDLTISKTHSITSLPIKTTQTAKCFTASTLLSADQNSSSSVSTSVIAGVTVSIIIVIAIVILIVVMFRRRKLKKESTNNNDTPTVRLGMNSNTFSGNVCNQQVPTTDEHTNTNSTVCIPIKEQNSTQNMDHNTNSYSNMSDKGTTIHYVSHSISDSDHTGIDEDQTSIAPNRFVSTDKEMNGYYNTIHDNRDTLVSGLVSQNVEYGTRSKEGNYSVVNKLHPISAQPEYATVNKNVGYKNFNEILRNKTQAAVNEYNDITDDNTTIRKTEPAKNVYSKLRENIRHFDNTYGDLGESMEAGEDNSTQAHDNTYFILEAEGNAHGQKLDLNK